MISTGLSEAGTEAIGYVGGGVLAICLIPQIGKIVLTRSARDISVVWSLLYMTGLSLSLVYLILKNAMAAWLPLVLEIAGCLIIIGLKYFFECTTAGRQWSLQKQLPEGFNPDVSVHSLPGISHVMSVTGATDQTNWRAAVDRSWHGEMMATEMTATDSSMHGSKHGTRSHVDVQCCQGSSESSSQVNIAPGVTVVVPASEVHHQQQQCRESLFPAGWQSPRAVHPISQIQQQQQFKAEDQC